MSTTRELLVGLEGPEVRITGRVAVELVGPITVWVRRSHALGEVIDADVLATVHALEVAASVHGSSDIGTAATPETAVGVSDVGSFPHDEVGTLHDHRMTTATAAKRIGCTDRQVRNLAARRMIPGRQLPGGQWTFDPADVDRYAAGRAAKGA